jgi:hypothetical protein
MFYRLTADVLVLFHLGFIFFVVCGGFLAWRWRKVAWIHVPVACWGALIEFFGWICPLTPLENELRILAGDHGYQGGFIEYYILPMIYPAELTIRHQIGLGILVLLLNGFAYSVYFIRRRKIPSSSLN